MINGVSSELNSVALGKLLLGDRTSVDKFYAVMAGYGKKGVPTLRQVARTLAPGAVGRGALGYSDLLL